MRDPVPSLKRLRALDAAVRLGSLSTAARQLSLSQPALTQAINALEADYGVHLLERRKGGSQPTAEGAIFARRVVRCLDRITAAVGFAVSDSQPNADPARLASRLTSAQLRNLLAIWRHGTFRTAARALGVAEPTLQRPARDLEAMLRVPLYKKTVAGHSTNAVGAELARRLNLALAEIRSGAEELGARAALSATSLTIGVLALAPRTLLARAMSPLLKAYPAHRLEVVEGPYDALRTRLRDGSLDMIFGALRSPPAFDDLREEPLFDDPYAVVCRRGHRLATAGIVRPADLAEYDWVMPTRGLPRRDILEQMIAEWGLDRRTQIETSCLGTIIATLCASDGISLLSQWHIRLDGHSSLVALDGLPSPGVRRIVGLTTRSEWLPTPFQAEAAVQIRDAARALVGMNLCGGQQRTIANPNR